MAGEPKGNADQVRARRAWVVEQTIAGYSIADIAEAGGITKATVASDRHNMTRQLRGVPRRSWKSQRPRVPLERFDWRAASPVVRDTTYTRMTPVRHVEAMLQSVQADNGLNRLAHNITAADRADDRAWLTKTRRTLVDAARYIAAMLEVMDEEDARLRAAKSLAARDDVTRLARPGASNTSRRLPPPGMGELPSPLYAVLWRYRYANKQMDDATIAAITRYVHYKDPRQIRLALEEFDKATGWTEPESEGK